MIRSARTIVIPGGSGYLGRVLARHFVGAGDQVILLSRRPAETKDGVTTLAWDAKTLGPWATALEGADVVINLAGRSVNCRYTARNKQLIYDSRLHSTKVLGDAIAAASNPPRVWINSSSATIYRHAEDRAMDEHTGEIGTGFSVDVCQRWERMFFESETPHTRKVALRTAMVFGGGKGGVMDAFDFIVRAGLGGTIGPGTQYMSWLHHEDFAHIIEWIVAHDSIDGAVNASSPNPVVNRAFMKAYRRAWGVPVGLPTFAWMLEIGAFVIRTESELLLKSRRVVPTRLLESGYEFRHPDWDGALRTLVAR